MQIRNPTLSYSTKIFIEKANKKHKDKYDYSCSVYTKSSNQINIKCPEHGEFSQRANNHIAGSGCPTCARKIHKVNLTKILNRGNRK